MSRPDPKQTLIGHDWPAHVARVQAGADSFR